MTALREAVTLLARWMDAVAAFVGAGTVNPTVNTGRLYIVLKPRDQRKSSVEEIMQRLRNDTSVDF